MDLAACVSATESVSVCFRLQTEAEQLFRKEFVHTLPGAWGAMGWVSEFSDRVVFYSPAGGTLFQNVCVNYGIQGKLKCLFIPVHI